MINDVCISTVHMDDVVDTINVWLRLHVVWLGQERWCTATVSPATILAVDQWDYVQWSDWWLSYTALPRHSHALKLTLTLFSTFPSDLDPDPFHF